MVYYNNTLFNRLIIQEKLHSNIHSTLNIHLAGELLENQTQNTKQFHLFDDESIKMDVERKNWGVFEVLSIHAKHDKMEASKSAFIGYEPEDKNTALYLSEHNNSLSLVGNVKLIGDCFLPMKGYQSGYLNGKNLTTTKPIQGKVSRSSMSVPKINKLKCNYVASKLNDFNSTEVKEISLSDAGDSLYNSFHEPTVVIYSMSDIVLTKQKFTGNIKIISGLKIEILPEVKLKDVIVSAKEIIIHEGTEARAQFFASKTIKVGANSKVMFPSFLGVIRPMLHNRDTAKVEIHSNAIIHCDILACNNAYVNNIEIAPNCNITGQVASKDFCELRSELKGSLFCSALLLKLKTGIYTDYLFDASIDSRAMQNYTGSSVLNNENHKKIIKWIN